MPGLSRTRLPRLHLGDFGAGISAALVVIPQSLAFARLAGMPPERGLHVAILAPLPAALLASYPYLGTGPTAITSLLTFGALSALAPPGSSEYVGLAALLALLVGAIRVAMGWARAGGFAYLMSEPVLVGFTAGAAFVIVASQVPTILDAETTSTNPFLAAVEAVASPPAWEPAALAVALGVAVVLIGGKRLHRLFPGILVAVALALVVSAASGYRGSVVGPTVGTLPGFTLDLPWKSLPRLLAPGVVIALVGFFEPASIARRYSTLERRRWDPNRELVSQGVACLVSGLGGGFPAGGSFSRTALMRDWGARTRLSGVITALTVLALLPALPVLARLPNAALGAIVVVSVRELIRIRPFREYRRYTRLQFRIALATLVLTVALAPRVEWAIVIGVGLSIGAHLTRELRLSVSASVVGDTLHLHPKGVLYFASAHRLDEAVSAQLSSYPEARRLVIHLDGLGRVDVSGALALRRLLEDAGEAGLRVELADIPPQARKIVARVIDEGGDRHAS